MHVLNSCNIFLTDDLKALITVEFPYSGLCVSKGELLNNLLEK